MSKASRVAPRKPWVAGFQTLVWPGLGHIYSGYAKRGLLVYGLVWVAALLSLAVLIEIPVAPLNILLAVLIVLSAYVAVILDATRLARIRSDAYELKAYHRWYVYVTLIGLAWFVVQPAIAHTVRTVLVQAFVIPSGGMEKTLVVGDHILVNKFVYGLHHPIIGKRVIRSITPKRGDVIVFRYPKDRSRIFIKRVLGLPGDELEIRRNRVHISGSLLEEAHAKFDGETPHGSILENLGPVTVSPGHLFVLGDNRRNSLDSRSWGFLPMDNVLGRAATIYWSWDATAGRVRWERIGKLIR